MAARDATRRSVYLLYGISGFVSLGYQVAWFRIYVDWFGSNNLTFALVVTNFIAGLGLGALASRRFTDAIGTLLRVGDRLRRYGIVELLVTASVLLTPLAGQLPADLWGRFPYHEVGEVYMPDAGYQLAQLAIAVACVFVPCFFMGVTFPLLCDVYRGAPGAERFPSALYAWNTLGACSGVLAGLFVLLPWLGHERMLLVLAGANGLIGVYFLARGGAGGALADPGAGLPAVRGTRPAPGTAGRAATSSLLTLAVLSGFVAGGLEGDMFKRIDFLSAGTSSIMALIAFWAILAIFLASWTVRAVPAMRLSWIKAAFVAAFVAYAAAWEGEGLIRNGLWVLEGRPATGIAGFDPAFITRPWLAVLFVGLFVFPAFFCISLLLPWVCNRIHGDRRHLGLAYGLNTLAFCAGLVGFTHVAPAVNIFYSLKLMMVLLFIGVVLMLVLPATGSRPWAGPAAIAAFVAACLLTPRSFDRSYMVPGGLAASGPVRALKSNAAHTTFVVGGSGGDFLFFERHPMTSTEPTQSRYMRLMAHFPLLAQPRPERALLIGYGVGNTASAIALHGTIAGIDVVDLNENVIATAPEFAEFNDGVHADPRIRYIIDDGRNYLNVTDRSYDLITSEPPPPMQAGVYRLYTADYYRQVLDHLTPRGMMTQWVPSYQMPQEATRRVIRTFLDVFPHALIFTGGHREFIIVGSRGPIDLALLERRFREMPAVARELRRLGAPSPMALLARIVQGDGELRQRFGEGRILRDVHNDLEFMFQDPDAAPVITFDPAAVLADIDAGRLACGSELAAVMTHPGRLQHHVPHYPLPTLLTAADASSGSIRLGDTDWRRVDELNRDSIRQQNAGRLREALATVRRSLAAVPEQPAMLLRAAWLQMALGRDDDAIRTLHRLFEIEPGDATGRRMLGRVLWRQGRRDEAVASLRRAVELDPYSPDAHLALGETLVEAGEPESGLDHLRRAADLDPRRADLRRALRRALDDARLRRDATGDAP